MTEKPWAGVFTEATDKRVEAFTESISYDAQLAAVDIRGSLAHARMLSSVGLLSADEYQQLEAALRDIGSQIERGEFAFRTEWEDIHMHIERALIEKTGDVGRKLHTGRSRNDQVATDLRLWVRDSIDHLDGLLVLLQQAFVSRCDRDAGVILPGYTHLQRAQPVLAAHYWLAYCEKYERDRQRLADCRKRVNVSPLGAAALAGTTLPIDRRETAQRLGFADIAANSLDAVSDRDFALEFTFVLSVIATHLATWAEEWILWTTTEFDFIKLPQQFCTGSSIMPQKINPDVLELTRGKTARVIGSLQTLFILVKGLPLTYNRDLQEDKPPIFDAYKTVRACLELAAPLVAGAELKREAIAARLDRGHLDATTLMEACIAQGVPQRTAHKLVGQLVRLALDRGVRLQDLSVADLQGVEPSLDGELLSKLGVKAAVAAFVSEGSTGPAAVATQIVHWQRKLGL